MATYDLEEQEQLEELKTWWKLHGTVVTLVVSALAMAMVGWQGWQWWQHSQSAQAAQLFGSVQQALATQDVKQVRQLSGELIDKFSSTVYAETAAMLAGRQLAESGDLKSAAAQYGWVAENARDDGLRDLARLRQAVVLVDEKHYDAAQALLAVPPAPGLMPRYLELRGDVLRLQGKSAEAAKAFDEAIRQFEMVRQADDLPPGEYLDILKAKREASASTDKAAS